MKLIGLKVNLNALLAMSTGEEVHFTVPEVGAKFVILVDREAVDAFADFNLMMAEPASDTLQ